jgi:phage repressor protein C with HTH and peptisase S24 domain
MGEGVDNLDADMVIDVLRVTRQWVDKTFKNVSRINNLRFIHAIGDSMEPTFSDGDILLVDTGISAVTVDGVYVLDAHDRLFIKRVRRRIDGEYEISSDNASVKTVDVLNGGNQVAVKGRVVWVWNGRRV